jgi:hypothetical protein
MVTFLLLTNLTKYDYYILIYSYMSKIFIVNKEYISENNKYHDVCVELTYKSKLLYNAANYLIKTN